MFAKEAHFRLYWIYVLAYMFVFDRGGLLKFYMQLSPCKFYKTHNIYTCESPLRTQFWLVERRSLRHKVTSKILARREKLFKFILIC